MFKNKKNKNRMQIKKDAVGKLLKTFDQKFKIVIFTENEQVLGKGAFGKCYLGILKNQQTSTILEGSQSSDIDLNDKMDLTDERIRHNIVVVKEIKKNQKDFSQQQLYKKQIQNLSLATKISSNNLNLVRCYPFTFSSQHSYYMVMQFCQGKSLDRLMSKRVKSGSWFNYFQFLKIFTDLIKGYEALMRSFILHEDLKPENIFIKEKNFKIGDFGLSFCMNKQNVFGRGGSQSYNAIQKYKDQINVSHKSDIYAIGIILFKLFYGIHPYYEKYQWEQYRNHEIQKILRLRNINQQQNKVRITRWQQIQIFIKFYESRKLKSRNILLKKPVLTPDLLKQYGKPLQQLFQNKIPALIHKMISKDIEQRISFNEVNKFIKENKTIQVIIREITSAQNQQMNQISFFKQLNQQNQDYIELPFKFSQIGQKVVSFQQESDIQKEQIVIRSTLLKTQNQERKLALIKRYPRFWRLKNKIQKINEISRFLMEVYYELNYLDLSRFFKMDSFNSSIKQALQNQMTNYEQKKIQLQFVVERYLLSFLNIIKFKIDKQIQQFQQPQMQLIYRENVDLLLQIIDKNKQFLQSELFLSEEDVSDFQRNKKDLQKVIFQQFLQLVALNSKNLLLIFFCLTILQVKQNIESLMSNQKEISKQVETNKKFDNEKQQQMNKQNYLEQIKQRWNEVMRQQKNLVQSSLMYQNFRRMLEDQLKKRNIACFPQFQ